MIHTLDGCPLPIFRGANGILYAGEREIGTYIERDGAFVGRTADDERELVGDTRPELARAVWLMEKGKDG